MTIIKTAAVVRGNRRRGVHVHSALSAVASPNIVTQILEIASGHTRSAEPRASTVANKQRQRALPPLTARPKYSNQGDRSSLPTMY